MSFRVHIYFVWCRNESYSEPHCPIFENLAQCKSVKKLRKLEQLPVCLHFSDAVSTATNPSPSRPEARYGLPRPPPPRGNFVDHDFLEASCLASFLQHVSPLAMEALLSNSPLYMLPIQRHKFNIKSTEVRIHVNMCRCSTKIYLI